MKKFKFGMKINLIGDVPRSTEQTWKYCCRVQQGTTLKSLMVPQLVSRIKTLENNIKDWSLVKLPFLVNMLLALRLLV